MFDELKANIDVSSDYESHEGAGTGLDLVAEEVWAEALAVLGSVEPCREWHEGAGAGQNLDPADAIRQAEAILMELWEGGQS